MSEPTERNATLKSLVASPGKLSPGFSSPRKAYVLHVTQEVTDATVTPTAAVTGACLEVNGAPVPSGQASRPVPLEVGRNLVQVDVTAPDGQTRDRYTVKVVRAYPTPNWVRVAEHNPWVPRDSAGELVFDGRMWLFGGYTPGLVSDVWNSPDGVNWTQTGSIPDPEGINIPVTFVYGGRMWVASQGGKLFSSADGKDWSLVTDQAPWKGRYSAGAVVFRDRMWVLGGGGGGRIHNDLWSSSDGVHWALETAEAPWSKRQLFSMVAVHNGRIWLLGGGVVNYHPFRAYRDVWSSADGRTWIKVTDCAPWPARIWSSSAVYRNRLWVLTGFRAEPTWNNFNDVWYSSDGAHWRQLATEAIWSPRHEVSVYVFDGKLWVVGGNAWPLMNDTWVLDIPGLTFLSPPVIEDFVTAQYSYQAHADFNESGGTVRYRLIERPDWLSIDADSGLIRGTLPVVGDFKVTVEAYDTAGETARQSYTLHVLPLA